MPSVPELLGAWGIRSIDSIEVPQLGTMNETWLVRHPNGRVVLRRHRVRDRRAVASEHEVIDHVRAMGIPCPRLVPTPAGARIVDIDGRLHSLYSWEPGSHAPRNLAGPRRSRAAGVMLARIHDALSSLPAGLAGALQRDEHTYAVVDTYRRIEHLQAAIRRGGDPRWAWIVPDLDERRAWLESHPVAPTGSLGAVQVIHGDYQLTNVLFEGDSVSCVVDWDKARVSSWLLEVVRALDHGLGLEVRDTDAFIEGYRTIRPLSDAQLAVGVEHWTHQQAHSLWVLERICLHDDVRVEPLATRFRPFAERWAEARFA